MGFYEPVIRALNEAQVRYVVVGGLAVVLHGYARLTVDLDLAVDLEPSEATKVIDSLLALNLRPTAPVDPAGFADATTREQWTREKNMEVFSLTDPADPLRQVDLFVREPIPFEELWSRSSLVSIGETTVARIAAISDLIRMKTEVGRPQDIADIDALKAIEQSRNHE